MLFLTSIYFVISKLILFFWYSFHVPCIILNPQTFIFTLYVPCPSFFLINHNQKQVLLIKWAIFFWSSKMFFCSFQHFESIHIHYVVLKLINVVKLDVENNSNDVSTLSNVVNTNFEIVGLKLFNVVNFNVDIHNVVSTLIW